MAQSLMGPERAPLSGQVLESPLGREVNKAGFCLPDTLGTLPLWPQTESERERGEGYREKGLDAGFLGGCISQMTIGISIRTP